ncbi:hypothetical protein Sgly_0332 [Syntrophobotulus glycolicus DSM 8271]|uniref:Sigma-70 region 4 type 2 n=1 Tax=Syntrophobotulus glycolicus (strain DSM 8271 / FlGlyR) TaxID=645991 RepID=F0SXF2_SYNGF|nr:sigma-70 family RNA polymerase sigma factor [Syntrophobotulus glycolicus]ADY54698.1 hypothetical protein Sgly_0332 [Syntrophobotulus glycolicus DSM 8271]
MTKKLAPEVLKIIETAVNKAAKESVGKAVEYRPDERNFFRETEILLYNYPALKLKVAQDEEFLYNPEAQTDPPAKSKDIVYGAIRGGHGLDIDQYTKGVKSSMMRTRQEVLRVERALETIRDDQYYGIIPFKYWDGMTMEEIAGKFECDERTLYRQKNRLVNKIKIMLFGADALK